MPYINVKDASFAYDGQTVLSDVSFSVSPGDYLCIVGENGSGKSTLMKGLLRLVSPVRGEVILGGGLTQGEIGYLPQQNMTQRDFPASVREVVESGIRGRRLFLNKEDRTMARNMMALMEIVPLEKKSFMDLSGGQRQRALLARALCAAKKLLLMDEPTAGLDPIASRDLYTAIERINREEGISIIMISHDIKTAVQYASHILHLQQTPVFYGKTADYKASHVARHFLGEYHV